MNENNYPNNYSLNGYNDSTDYNQYNSDISEYMNMDSGFEAGPVVKSFEDFKTIACEEVISKSFLFMVVGLCITAFAAFTTDLETAYRLITTNAYWGIIIAELLIVFVSNWAVSKNKPILAGVLFVIYSYLTGVIFAPLLTIYTGASLVKVLLITATTFGVMAVYGLVTKRDLSSLGSLFLMALIGLIIVGFANIFLFQSTVLDLIASAVGVIIFVGLTAYDTQKIKKMVAISNDNTVLSLAILGAFELYLDFINLFLKLLRILGKRK